MTPLALYIHWPFCKSKCPYCDFNSHVRDEVDMARWKTALLTELAHMAQHAQNRTLRSIFFGGGTPSLMPPDIAHALIERARALWPQEPDMEITLEANPTSVETGTFPAFKAAGINRASLGVQSLDDAELRFLGRGHSSTEARRAIALSQKHFSRTSFDLIYARPNQTPEGWETELTEALSLCGSHLSLYQLTIEENTAFHHAYAKGQFALPNEEESEILYRLTESITAAHGLTAYEVSNYAAPGQQSRHNLAYWQGVDYLCIGPGAHGRLTLTENNARRRMATTTIKSPERWLEAVSRDGHATETWQEITPAEEAEERLMMGIRLTEGINYADYAAQTGHDLRTHLNENKLKLYTQHGLLEPDETRLKTTLKGRLMLTRLTAELLTT